MFSRSCPNFSVTFVHFKEHFTPFLVIIIPTHGWWQARKLPVVSDNKYGNSVLNIRRCFLYNLSVLKQIYHYTLFTPNLFTGGVYFMYGMFGPFWAAQLSAAVF